MFVNFNYDIFPLVEVIFGENIESYEELDTFFQGWLQLYEQKKPFTFLLNTTQCGSINAKYCYYMAKKISIIKKQNTHYLIRTIVILRSKWIKNLMKILFKIIKPIAPVYIVKSKEDASKLYERMEKNLLKSDLNYDFIDNK